MFPYWILIGAEGMQEGARCCTRVFPTQVALIVGQPLRTVQAPSPPSSTQPTRHSKTRISMSKTD